MSEYIVRIDRLTDEAREQFSATHTEVIRCRDCSYFERNDEPRVPRCGRTERIAGENGFCSWAKRKPAHLTDAEIDRVLNMLGFPGVDGLAEMVHENLRLLGVEK